MFSSAIDNCFRLPVEVEDSLVSFLCVYVVRVSNLMQCRFGKYVKRFPAWAPLGECQLLGQEVDGKVTVSKRVH